MIPSLPNSRPRIAFLQAGWHHEIVDEARKGFIDAIDDAAEIEFFELPGAFELPLHAATLAASGRFDAVAAAGFVVDGGIYRHEFVADAVISGLMRAQMDSGVPVFSCVLTPIDFDDSDERQNYFIEHLFGKGQECAVACLDTLDARAAIAQATQAAA